jgi:hypothetical protein
MVGPVTLLRIKSAKLRSFNLLRQPDLTTRKYEMNDSQTACIAVRAAETQLDQCPQFPCFLQLPQIHGVDNSFVIVCGCRSLCFEIKNRRQGPKTAGDSRQLF